MRTIYMNLIYLLAYSSQAQEFTISIERNNVAFLGLDNHLNCVVQGYSNKAVLLLTKNGIIKNEGGCRYIFHPKELGQTDIVVKVKTKKGFKQIGIYPFRVKRFPLSMAMVGPYMCDTVPKMDFIAQGGVVARLMDSDFEAYFRVVSYKVIVMRDSSCLFTYKNTDPAFEPPLIIFLKQMKNNDHVIIYDIDSKGPDGNIYRNNVLSLIIKE